MRSSLFKGWLFQVRRSGCPQETQGRQSGGTTFVFSLVRVGSMCSITIFQEPSDSSTSSFQGKDVI